MQRLISARAGEGTYRGSFQEWAWRDGLCVMIDQVDWQQVEDLAGELFELLSILVFAHQTFLNSNSKKFEKIVAQMHVQPNNMWLVYCFGTFSGTCGTYSRTWDLGSGVWGLGSGQAGTGKSPKLFGNGHNFINFENWASFAWSLLLSVKFSNHECRDNFSNG